MSQLSQKTLTFKILILGDSNVGKTCIVHRFCDENFIDGYISTIGIDFKQKLINLDDIPIKLQIWDSAGQERFRTLTTAYYRGAMGIILMYDVTNIDSFKHIPYWFHNIEENASPDVVKILVANKSDAQQLRVVDHESGLQLAQQYSVPFFECSCKSNINIHQIFHDITQLIHKQYEQQSEKFDYFGQHFENTINNKMLENNYENWTKSRCNSCQTN
ncbi:uncharacterized protein LOC128960425 [Oppia nitens]|uniref:uncharacterized protein LOC128960425 n=1 Tax=Oppia nitens TaxID=1686743 RepID=UPI0023DB191D|nr:uncharacterized protein LOC128960425 [Oppia nitens]